MLFQLDPIAVLDHVRRIGHHLPPTGDRREARLALLHALEIPWPAQEDPQPLGADVVRLVHSYAHRTIRHLAAFAGIERDALGE